VRHYISQLLVDIKTTKSAKICEYLRNRSLGLTLKRPHFEIWPYYFQIVVWALYAASKLAILHCKFYEDSKYLGL